MSWINYLSSGETLTLRINIEDKPNIISYDLKNSTFIFEIKNINKEIKGYEKIWLRRGNHSFVAEETISSFTIGEKKKIQKFLLSTLENSPKTFGSILGELEHNKLLDLEIAKSVGLKIPNTFILSQIDSEVMARENKIITKFIDNYVYNDLFSPNLAYTIEVNSRKLVSTSFFPSLIQEKIDKLYEIRIFIWEGIFYPMAIFSQLDEDTMVDYRYMSKKKSVRVVPYTLPTELEVKLESLFSKLKITTGSVDLIVNTENEYIFLEVNRVGQFDWLSKQCNYFIEEKIAKTLIYE